MVDLDTTDRWVSRRPNSLEQVYLEKIQAYAAIVLSHIWNKTMQYRRSLLHQKCRIFDAFARVVKTIHSVSDGIPMLFLCFRYKSNDNFREFGYCTCVHCRGLFRYFARRDRGELPKMEPFHPVLNSARRYAHQIITSH